MQHRGLLCFVFLTACFASSSAYPQSDTTSGKQNPEATVYGERIELTEILDAAQRNSKKSFLVNRNVPRDLAVGNIDIRDITYPMLLQILRNNDLAAFTANGIVNVIPVGIVRQYPLPEMPEHKNSLGDEEWVTGVIKLENAPAPSFIPIMRPMMPKAGHLSANPHSNSIIIVDRLGNARRIAALIKKLDQATSPQPE